MPKTHYISSWDTISYKTHYVLLSKRKHCQYKLYDAIDSKKCRYLNESWGGYIL